MTKNEKIAISVSATVGFVVFCIIVILTGIPIVNAISYMLTDSLRVQEVYYDELAYAMGEDFVFLSEDFVESQFMTQSVPNIEYFGKSGSFRNHPIQGARKYYFNLEKRTQGKYYRIRFTCAIATSNPNMTLENVCGDSSYTVFGYDDALDSSYVGELTDVTFHCLTPSDTGKINELNVVFSIVNAYQSPAYLSVQDQQVCQKILESMLNHTVGYNEFNATY